MRTYQDLLEISEKSPEEKANWLYEAIGYYKTTDDYKNAVIAEDYATHRNTTVCTYQKMLYTLSGQAVPDNISANYKLSNNFFPRFLTQLNQFLLGNGISWGKEETANKVGKDFDYAIQKAGGLGLQDGVSFGFWNNDHVDVFNVREFMPFYDENNSALMAGLRFWQIEDTKPLRATLYEIDGYTSYEWNKREYENGKYKIETIIGDKKTYKQILVSNPTDGEKIYNYENYEGFPIVPLFGNSHKQSELIGRREQIDAYDLIKSGFANDLDDASQIYWTISNAGGMDDIDLVKFVEHMKTVKASVVDDNAHAESHTVEVPYASREALLERLRADIYDDFMMLDVKQIAGGAITATQILASYEPLNEKADDYEYQISQFIKGIFAIIGIDDEPTFTRSYIVNVTENVQVLLQSAQYLPQDYITEKIVTILGDTDKLEEIKESMASEDLDRYGLYAQENRPSTGTAGEEA